jgi:hypothetical protein
VPMTPRMDLVSTAPVGTTTATTTPCPPSPLHGALRRSALPIFSLGAFYRYPRGSTVEGGTGLKIMVSPVRIRVSPLLFYSDLQAKRLALAAPLHVERRLYHNRCPVIPRPAGCPSYIRPDACPAHIAGRNQTNQ